MTPPAATLASLAIADPTPLVWVDFGAGAHWGNPAFCQRWGEVPAALRNLVQAEDQGTLDYALLELQAGRCGRADVRCNGVPVELVWLATPQNGGWLRFAPLDQLHSADAITRRLLLVGTHKRGQDYLDTLLAGLQAEISADYLFVGRYQIGQATIKTQSLFADGKKIDNIEYALTGTPCEQVLGQEACLFPGDVCQLFPADLLLQQMHVHAYIGVALYNSAHEAIGILVGLFRQRLQETQLVQSLFHLFAERLGAELERSEHETALKTLNTELEQRVAERTKHLSEALDHLRQAQDELIQSEKLASLGRLVAGVAHELNTPIGNCVTVASSLVERTWLIQQEFDRNELRKQSLHDYLQACEQGSSLMSRNLHHAAQLIGNFKQIAVDQTSEIRRPFELGPTLHDILATFLPSYKHRAHCVQLECDANLQLNSYPGALSQIITNLIANAFIHGLGEAGTGGILIDCQRISSTHIRIAVADEGSGIGAEHLPHIFEPFYSTRLGQGGSGLGLYIVHALVHKVLGGTIQVETALHHGTRFILDLPIEAPATSTTDAGLVD